jgi:hypothetical protein
MVELSRSGLPIALTQHRHMKRLMCCVLLASQASLSARFETSRPIAQACLNSTAPLPSWWSLNWI